MKALIIATFLLSMVANATDLNKSSMLGDSYSAFAKKYTATEQIPCDGDEAQVCQEKLKSECVCYRSVTSLQSDRSKTYFLTVHADKIVEVADQRKAMPEDYAKYFGYVEAFSGDEKPDQIFTIAAPSNGHQRYAMFWRRNGSSFQANAVCPLTEYGGTMQLRTQLRKCYLNAYQASSYREIKPPEYFKKAEAAY